MDIPLGKLPNGHQYFKLEVLQEHKVSPEDVKTALEATKTEAE